jgi:hypothetical protein
MQRISSLVRKIYKQKDRAGYAKCTLITTMGALQVSHDPFGTWIELSASRSRDELLVSPILSSFSMFLCLLGYINKLPRSLARELKLGREVPQNSRRERDTENGDPEICLSDTSSSHMPAGTPMAALVEEMKEERRRLWWLLYMIDRHLGLCYNRPLAMLDNECEDLYQPVPDTLWQAGEFYTGNSGPKRKGLSFQCTSHDVFGFFLPLMTILGDIVDLNAQKNHPRFGQRRTSDWQLHESEITLQLERYAYSLQEFKNQHGCGPPNDDAGNNNDGSDSVRGEWKHQTRKVVAYATHIMHVLHILLHGKWDPVALLEDDNMWICSQSFLAATSNAISAAHAVEEILELDPDLSFMPYLFGMYLLQGSLILLLLADKLSTDTNDGVIRACETIVRAHEAAVVTLNTEYQVRYHIDPVWSVC